MLGLVLSQLQQKVGTWMALCRAKVSQMILHCNNIIVVGIDRGTLIVQYIKRQYVALKSNIKALVARLTNQVLLIKVGLMNVLHKIGQLGQQLQITARQILQRVLSLLKRGS
jgi:hypothetical protein